VQPELLHDLKVKWRAGSPFSTADRAIANNCTLKACA